MQPDFKTMSILFRNRKKTMSEKSTQQAIQRVQTQISSCESCDLGKNQEVRVLGWGSERPTLLMVGESPGKREAEQGKALVGPTAEVIEWMIGTLGLKEDQIWRTDAIKCPTPDYRNPLDKEIRACMVHLKNEIRFLNPKAILAMGRISAYVLTGNRRSIDELRRRPHYFHSIPVIITFHPSAIKRFPFLEGRVEDDLKQLKPLLHTSESKSLWDLREELQGVSRPRWDE